MTESFGADPLSAGWILGEPELVAPALEPERILVEYEVPQVGVYRQDDNRFLGLVLDEDREVLRRVFFPVSGLALEALGRRATTLRELARSSDWCYVQDEPLRGQPVRWWRSVESPPEDVLPSPGSFLPSALAAEVLALLAKPAVLEEETALHIESTGSASLPQSLRHAHGVALATLGSVVTAFAEFVEALTGVQPFGTALSPGSLNIRLDSDPPGALDTSLSLYSKVLQVVEANEHVETALQALEPASRKPAAKLFDSLAKTQCDVLLTRHAQGSFLSPRRAHELSRLPAAELPEPSYHRVRVQGRLTAFDTDKLRFAFHDTRSVAPKIYQGLVAPAVDARLRQTQQSVEVGYRDVLYEAEIAVAEEEPDGKRGRGRPAAKGAANRLENLEVVSLPKRKS